MSAIIEDTSTKIKVNAKTDNIDSAINNLDATIFPDVIEIFKDIKEAIEDSIDEVADKAGERLKSEEEEIIWMNGTVDTTYMVSTIFTESSGDGEVTVGPTALSDRGFPYPVVIDQGSIFYGGKPFVEPAIMSATSDFGDIAEEVVMSKIGG